MLYLAPDKTYHFIESVAIANLAKLEQCLRELNTAQDKYGTDSHAVVSLLLLICELSGVSQELLFQDIDSVIGAIATVNFSVKDERSDNSKISDSNDDGRNETISLEDYHYQLVTSLVNSELAVDLESALKIASELPYKDIEGYLKARIKFLNRDKIEEEKKEKFKEEKIKEVRQEIADGTFFNGLQDALIAQAQFNRN